MREFSNRLIVRHIATAESTLTCPFVGITLNDR